MYDEFNPYNHTYRGGYMPYEMQEDVQGSYGYLADDLNFNIGYNMQTPYWYEQMRVGNIAKMENIEEMYPEIYKIIYPMVKKACNRNTRSVSSDLIDEMAEDIYSNIETNNVISLNINVENLGNENNRGGEETKKEVEEKNLENRSIENRKRKGLLFDFIKVLLIRELLDRCPGNRPRPPRPPRPNYPGRPPKPGDWEDIYPGRPPMPRY